MPLSQEQKDTIREEETIRVEARKSGNSNTVPITLVGRFIAFSETKLGGWLITTVFAALVGFAYTKAQTYVDRARIKQQAQAENSRRDADTVMRLMQALSSEEALQRQIGLVLLAHLGKEKGIDTDLGERVKLVLGQIKEVATRENATDKDRQLWQDINTTLDDAGGGKQAMAAAMGASGSTPVSHAVVELLPSVKLPTRVYIQIADEAQRPLAKLLASELRNANIIAPGIEWVKMGNTDKAQLRYCKDKIDEATVTKVRGVIQKTLNTAPDLLALSPSLCANVRANHTELWLAKA